MRKNEKSQVVIIALITALCLLGDSMLYVVLPTHWEEIGLASLWEVGILLSVNRFVRVPLNPVVSWIYQRISHRNGILIAVLLSVLTTASYGISEFWVFLLMRCIWGFAWTFLRLGAYFLIVNISTNENRGQFMGIYNGLFRLGSLVGMLVGGIAADLYGIQSVSYIFAAMTLLAVILAFRYVSAASASMNPKQPVTGASVPLWKNGKILWMLITGLGVAMVYQGMFTSTLSHIIDSNYNPAMLWGFAVGAASLAGILQALRWGWEPWLAPWFGKLSDRFGRSPMLIFALAAAALLFALINADLPIWPWLVVIIGVQLTATVLTTVMDAVAGDVAAQSSGKASVMTLYSVLTDLGAALGPALAYFISFYFGIGNLYWGAASLLILLAARWFVSVYPSGSKGI
jgi:MFS family permease